MTSSAAFIQFAKPSCHLFLVAGVLVTRNNVFMLRFRDRPVFSFSLLTVISWKTLCGRDCPLARFSLSIPDSAVLFACVASVAAQLSILPTKFRRLVGQLPPL